jgi:hypothetical protein
MALTDCDQCWETPCCCGYAYRDWSVDRRIALAAVILGVDEALVRGIPLPDEHPMKEPVKL